MRIAQNEKRNANACMKIKLVSYLFRFLELELSLIKCLVYEN